LVDIEQVAIKKLSGWTYFWMVMGTLAVPAIITTAIVLSHPR